MFLQQKDKRQRINTTISQDLYEQIEEKRIRWCDCLARGAVAILNGDNMQLRVAELEDENKKLSVKLQTLAQKIYIIEETKIVEAYK